MVADVHTILASAKARISFYLLGILLGSVTAVCVTLVGAIKSEEIVGFWNILGHTGSSVLPTIQLVIVLVALTEGSIITMFRKYIDHASERAVEKAKPSVRRDAVNDIQESVLQLIEEFEKKEDIDKSKFVEELRFRSRLWE